MRVKDQHELNRESELSELIDLGSSLIRAAGGTVYVLTIVGQVNWVSSTTGSSFK